MFETANPSQENPFKSYSELKNMATSNVTIQTKYFNDIAVSFGLSLGEWKLLREFKEMRNATFHPDDRRHDAPPTVSLTGDLSRLQRAVAKKASKVVFDDYQAKSKAVYS